MPRFGDSLGVLIRTYDRVASLVPARPVRSQAATEDKTRNAAGTPPAWPPERAVILILLGIVVLKLWILPLGTSFWLDETGTYWTIKDGPRQAIARCYMWPSQAPAYSAIAWAALALGGPHEAVLRLPSLIAGFATLLVVYRLGVRLLDREAAWLAVLALACMEPVAFAAADARPYAIALFAATSAILMLVRWLDTGSLAAAIGCALAVSLTIHVQYVFAVTLGVHAVYVAYRMYTGTRVKLPGAALILAGIALMCLPLTPHFLLVKRLTRSFADKPDPAAFFAQIVSPVTAGALLTGLLLARILLFNVRFRRLAPQRNGLFLLSAWALLPVCALYLFSTMTASRIFIPRYLLCAAPAFALLTAWAIRTVEPARARSIIALALAVASIATFGGFRTIWIHGREDWRRAMADVRSMAAGTRIPVLIRSGFVESAYTDWRSRAETSGFLFAPLLLYPSAGDTIPLPYRLDDRARSFLNETASSVLEKTSRFLLVNSDSNPAFDEWIEGRMWPLGFRMRKAGTYDRVRVLIFDRDRRLAPTVTSAD